MSVTAAIAIDTVVFDLGGVLIDWNPRHLYRKLFAADEAAMEVFLSEVCSPEWNAHQDRGRSVADAVSSLAAQHPDQVALIQAYYDRFDEMVAGPIEASVAHLDALRRAGTRILALSNWSAQTFAGQEQRFPFLDWFEARVVSGFEGVAKPDPAIFELLCDRHHVVPHRSLFVDDSLANVETARSLGFAVCHFRAPDDLERSLRELGLARADASER